jgi:ubiquinone/menaquinone biosynthesis C-methylase UbiE
MPEEYYYDEPIARRYDLMVPVPQAEVDFYLELAREAQAQGLRTLEPTCGTGRMTIPLAKAGIRMVGVDISPAMLAVGRERGAGLDIEWVEGDMRSFELGEQFGLAIIPVGSFQLLLEVEDQLACLRCIHRHLAPGGRLAFEIENPDVVAFAEWLTAKRGTLVRRPQRDYVDPRTGHTMLRLAAAGFEVEALYGDVAKSPYRATSPDFIWVARRTES